MENLHRSILTEPIQPSQKQYWSKPEIQDFSPTLIQQQEAEALIHLMTYENAFRLLSGSLVPS